MVKNIRSRALFVPQQHFEKMDPLDNRPISNFIHRTDDEKDKWIEETTEGIGDWKNLSRSIYLRWAITINAMVLAEKRYTELPQDQALQTSTLRSVDGIARLVPLAIWPSREAAAHYKSSTPLIAAYGVSDLVGAVEDIIFDCFEIFLRHNPSKFLIGPENKAFRKTFKCRAEQPKEWAAAWALRYNSWRRKRTYDPLYKVVLDYWREADLSRPSSYENTDVPDWAATIRMFSELRNLIIHGASTVSKELEELCKIKTNMSFDFKCGETLKVELHHLQSIECFMDQYLTALNIALIEKGRG